MALPVDTYLTFHVGTVFRGDHNCVWVGVGPRRPEMGIVGLLLTVLSVAVSPTMPFHARTGLALALFVLCRQGPN